MKAGFIKSALYYLTGIGLAAISYFTVEHEYIHAPALHHFIILITFTGGFLYLILAVVQYFKGPKTESLKVTIISNFFMTLIFVVYVASIMDDTAANTSAEDGLARVVIEESEDTTIMYQNGSPVYMKAKDSVLFDFIDSTKINWDKAERRQR